MEARDDGGPAFPFGISHIPDAGLTKRDYFAGQALIGLMKDWKLSEHDSARYAYQYADAMLEARK